MTKLNMRKPYDPSVRSSLTFTQPTRTKQSFKAECDINNIMSKYNKTGVLEHAKHVQGTYGDFRDVPDFQTARNILIQAEEAFMALPAKVRKRFDNNPDEFVEFFNDEANHDEAVKLGLLPPKQEERSDDIEPKAKSKEPKAPAPKAAPEPPQPD